MFLRPTPSISADFETYNRDKALAEYVPQSSKGTVLYTSRNRDVVVDLLLSKDPIEVGSMSSSEAHKLLNADVRRMSKKEDLSTLIDKLDYLPLAITQAVAFMTKRRKSASQYLDLFNKSDSIKARLLAHEFSDHGREARSRESLAKSWMISFDHIKTEHPRATDLLSLMSFYDRQSIPALLLVDESEDENELDFEEAIGVLIAFSFIKANDSDFDVQHASIGASRHLLLSLNGSRDDDLFKLRALFLTSKRYPDKD